MSVEVHESDIPSGCDQLERGRTVLQLLLAVQRELAAGTKPTAIADRLQLPPARTAWALRVLSGGA